MNIQELFQKVINHGASDLFIVAGLPPSMRINNTITNMPEEKRFPPATEEIVAEVYKLADERSMDRLNCTGDDDFSFAIPGLSRFRVSAYKQRGTLALVIRVISFSLPNSQALGIPP